LKQFKLDDTFKKHKCCVIIPTYNNQKTLKSVIDSVYEYTPDIIIVNDGSTDNTEDILKDYSYLDIISYKKNKGKGYALRKAFKYAVSKGYNYSITIDSDGQHYADDLPVFFKTDITNTLLIGSRKMDNDDVPAKSSFGNKFSNFWFKVETGIKLYDTQSGYRLYPINELNKLKFFTKKYEFEIEVIVKAAWENINIKNVPIKVYYPPHKERVSHFRPFKDFFRISLLNTYLVILAVLWFLPRKFYLNIKNKSFKEIFNTYILDKEESNKKIIFSVMLGFFMGIVPIWGYQLVTAILLAYLLKLNKAIVIITANISIPPMIPFILYGSFITGGLFMGKGTDSFKFSFDLSFDVVKTNLLQYFIGAVIFAIIVSLLMGLVTYLILNKKKHK